MSLLSVGPLKFQAVIKDVLGALRNRVHHNSILIATIDVLKLIRFPYRFRLAH